MKKFVVSFLIVPMILYVSMMDVLAMPLDGNEQDTGHPALKQGKDEVPVNPGRGQNVF
ncbi:hypothetical protein [Aquibacillus salsiterrae]|uniref:Uncharacterized protein n=1 Tax=Aquibacillus salsiterrae TaxID=2950439 RepID=A0A9X4AEH8_9BACI|nr:hypothetical protein [Aquibacillus salsiterrae]MDC3416917.1 hypothetical protein [Aquibacillus salsiterrae]